jgi:pantoate--beta-alanine ligase
MSIGFVPTMGYLHEGHLSLVRQAKKDCDFVVVSIFVNPTQFGPREDLKKYPRDLTRDLKLLSKLKVDAVFYPSAASMYPEGYKTYIYVRGLSEGMCGASRPGHFEGVATIVAKLFNIVKPDVAYFGKKDYQQQVVLKKMAADLNFDVKVVSLPTVREFDGLAMSSRNKYLSREERAKAVILNRSLCFAKQLIASGVSSVSKVKSAVSKLIKTKKGVKIDYIAIKDPESLEEVKVIKGKVLIAVAAYLGKTRLIDNIEVNA